MAVLAVHRDEGISGRDGVEERPGLQATIASVKAAPGAVVVVYSVSRLARRQRLRWNLLDAQGDYALPVLSATEPFDTSTPMGRAMLGMIATWNTLEADMVSERTRDALAEVKAQGRKLGAPSMLDLGAIESVRLAQALRVGELHPPLARRGAEPTRGAHGEGRQVVAEDGSFGALGGGAVVKRKPRRAATPPRRFPLPAGRRECSPSWGTRTGSSTTCSRARACGKPSPARPGPPRRAARSPPATRVLPRS